MQTPANLVHQQSVSTGTGDLTVIAVNGKQSFDAAFGHGSTTDVFDYFVSNQAAAEWERGTGHMSDAATLVRDTVLESSNSNAAVNFSAGTKDISNDIPAAKQVTTDTAQTLTSKTLDMASNTILGAWRILDHSAVASSLTGTTTETALANIMIPGGIIGANGMVRITTLWTGTSNANSKTYRVRHSSSSGASGNTYTSVSGITTTPTYKIQTEFHNRNSVSSQVGGLSSGTGGWGSTSLGLVTGTIDTSANSYINISGILADAADTLTLEAYTVEVLYRA